MTASSSITLSLSALSGTVILVGAGNMGNALLQSWLELGLELKSIAVIEPKPTPEISALSERGVRLNPSLSASDNACAVIVAVKPQVAETALPEVVAMIGESTVVISIMAGQTLQFLARQLPNAAIVRAMPNMPAAIGRGMTVAMANAAVTDGQHNIAHALLSASGAVEWIEDEALMDAVTAVSGSGPAYVFLLAEALAQAGVAAGLPAGIAATLARETVAGSGELLHRSKEDAAMLRKNVTSPGGTTAAALEVLTGPDGLDALMTKAVAAATRRSRELAG